MYQPAVANGYCTVFRFFEGWMAVSAIGSPNSGTLQVLLLLREAMASIVLRPFLEDVPGADFAARCPAWPAT